METMSSGIGSATVGSANLVDVASFGRAISGCATSGRRASGCTVGVSVAFVASGVGSEHHDCCAGCRNTKTQENPR